MERFGKSRRVGQHMDAAKNILDATDLKAAWRNGRCGHARATMELLHNLCATLSCMDCDASMSFTLKFGRPKAFEVTVNDPTVRPVGRASAREVRNFLDGAIAHIFVPSTQDTENPERSRVILSMIIEELTDGVRVVPSPKTDFAGPWRDINCSHKSVSCRLYGNRITLECADCATVLEFVYTGKDKFRVDMVRPPLPADDYGRHGADIILDVIREFADTVEIPGVMADKMSHDPDRDARHLAALVSLLERRGLLRRINEDPAGCDSMMRRLSAMLNTRREFVSSVKSLIAELGSTGLQFNEDGKHIGTRQGLEAMWLTWPCWFEGVGLDVGIYNPVGRHQYCVRCGFSTLGDHTDNGHWPQGCPECGYPGYLLDMRKGTGSAHTRQ